MGMVHEQVACGPGKLGDHHHLWNYIEWMMAEATRQARSLVQLYTGADFGGATSLCNKSIKSC